jgi:hypothetical protein
MSHLESPLVLCLGISGCPMKQPQNGLGCPVNIKFRGSSSGYERALSWGLAPCGRVGDTVGPVKAPMRPHQGTRSRISAGPAFPKFYKKSSGANHSLAAQPGKVSDRQTFRNEGKFEPHFKGQFWKRICEFESSHPSQPARSLRFPRVL